MAAKSKPLTKHFVVFYSPGTFLSEQTEKPVRKWDVEAAKKMAKDVSERYGATPYGFRFVTYTRGAKDLDSKQSKQSPMYYLGGTVETLEQVKARALPSERILLANMEGNKWHKIITNNNSWKITQPLLKGDVVLEWP